MARTKDRHIISEAVRKQDLWRRESHGADYPSGTYVVLVTDYDERLHVQYGNVGQVTSALYTHWDRDTGKVVSRESIMRKKRERVLALINQKDVV